MFRHVTPRSNGVSVEERSDRRCPGHARRGQLAGGQRLVIAGRRLPGPMWRPRRSSSSRTVRHDAGRHVTASASSFLIMFVTLSLSLSLSLSIVGLHQLHLS